MSAQDDPDFHDLIAAATANLLVRDGLLRLGMYVRSFRLIYNSRFLSNWRFALSDLQMNNARGYLAEFLVGTALGIEKLRRIEWDAFDLLWEGIRIEVKASARLQAWEQRRHSAIEFGGLKGTRWTPRDGEDPAGKQFNADVYVFCAHLEEEHSKYDQLDVSQWSFYVVPRVALVAYGAERIRLSTVLTLCGGKTAWESLPDAVKKAAADA